MSAPAKNRIPVSAPQTGIQSPFAALDLAGLPDPEPAAPVQANQPVHHKRSAIVLRREKSGRGGKTVVVAGPFPPEISDGELRDLARMARQHCGSGGTVREREIEIQGDQPARVRQFFEQHGFRVGGV